MVCGARWYRNPTWERFDIPDIRPVAFAYGIDGEPEIICVEHDAFTPYNSGCRLFIYKKADKLGDVWFRLLVNDGFEHHNGVKVF